MKQIMIIGAGASGLMAAVSAAAYAREQQIPVKITVIEHASSAANKLLVTGNGRCNIGNRSTDLSNYYADDLSFVEQVFRHRSPQDNLDYFRELGLELWERDGYLYPLSRQASTVRNLLLNELESLGVKLRYSTHITSIGTEAGQWYAETETGYRYRSDALILASGTRAGKTQGADDSGINMVSMLGLTMQDQVPALVQLCTKESSKWKLTGVRAICTISVPLCNLHEYGEVQFTEYGISGIPVFQLSGSVNQYLRERNCVEAELDFLPAYTREELLEEFRRRISRYEGQTVGRMLSGILHEEITRRVLEECRIRPGDAADMLDLCSLHKLTDCIKGMKCTITGSKGADQAQVMRGGVCTTELNPSALSAVRFPGLFICGELINADGKCGGYNLQWAFSTGYLAGRAACGRVVEA